MDKFYSKSIEDLAKNAFEKEADDAVSGSANWDTMQQLLDQEMPQKRKRRPVVFWFLIFLMAGLLITGASRYFSRKESIDAVHNIQTVDTENKKALPFKSEQNNLNKEILIIKKDNIKSNKESTKRSIVPPQINAATSNINKTTPKSNKTPDQIDKTPIPAPTSSAKDLQVFITETNGKDSLKQLEQTQKEAIDSLRQEKIEEKNDSAISKDTSIEKDSPIVKISDKNSEKKPSKWEWNLTIAPDFLLANMQPLHQPGFTIGVGVNYILTPKWRIRSGLLYNYTTVNASGDGYLYKPSPNLPSYTSLELRNVKGNLHVFEVPLLVRYTARPNKKWSFISSVGLSSLFFIKQQYTYDLLLNGSTPLLWNSASDTDDDGESHILNNLTIGTGLSVKTKRNLVLEIEPTFKLPLEELGEGHNKLGTIALYFNLRIPITKQKK
ncbi:MAG: porin family protein [Sediminibacterium sp.]